MRERICLCVRACVHECTCACICACACVFMSAFVGVCANQMCVRAGVRIYAHVRVLACACTCILIVMHVTLAYKIIIEYIIMSLQISNIH